MKNVLKMLTSDAKIAESQDRFVVDDPRQSFLKCDLFLRTIQKHSKGLPWFIAYIVRKYNTECDFVDHAVLNNIEVLRVKESRL